MSKLKWQSTQWGKVVHLASWRTVEVYKISNHLFILLNWWLTGTGIFVNIIYIHYFFLNLTINR